MRQLLSLQLGTWHPYKQANVVLWNHWGPRVFAPLFHELIPDANFNAKASLTTIVTFLTYVRLAYPGFKSNLDETLKEVLEAQQDAIAVSHLRDLRKLCEFFIPTVSHV